MTMSHTAIFETSQNAREAIESLRSAGVPDHAISIIGRDGLSIDPEALPETDRVLDEEGDERLTTDGQGHTLRGVLGGGALGALLGVAAVAIPGGFIAAGAIAAAGTGFIMGAGLGGLGELLTQQGVSPEDVAFYEERIGQGGMLISVAGDNSIEQGRIDEILASTGGIRAVPVAAAATITM